MELSEQQRQAVKEWLAAGASLSEVQRSLKSEFNLTMTYMDVRLLVLDIGASVQDKPEPKPLKAEAPPPPPAAAQPEDPYADADELEYEPGAPAEEGGALGEAQPPDGAAPTVALTLDRLVVPGAMVSGSVTFSDGVKARWLIDQMGRFGLDPETPGYRPSNADLQAFQMQLRAELRRHGYA
jgi:hypothetical protein